MLLMHGVCVTDIMSCVLLMHGPCVSVTDAWGVLLMHGVCSLQEHGLCVTDAWGVCY